MVATTLNGVLLTGDHASRPTATTVAKGALYACSTHALVYQSDASSWSTWATLSAGGVSLTTRGDLLTRDASALTRLAIGSADQVLKTDGTDPSWGKVLPANLDVSADNTTANATSGHHGLLPKLSGSSSDVLKGDGTWGAGGGGGGGDAILGQSGIGGATISGLQGSPDIDVAGTDDDEFNTTDTSDPYGGWTTLGSLAAANINSTRKSHLYLKSTQSSLRVDGLYKACPTIPFTMTANINEVIHFANYQTAGIFVGEASPGKILTLDFVIATGALLVERLLFTNPTTFSGTTASVDVGKHDVPIYLRMVVHSSTNIDLQYSFGGFIWQTLSTAYNPGFTVGSVGLFVNPQAAANSEALFDWVRFT